MKDTRDPIEVGGERELNLKRKVFRSTSRRRKEATTPILAKIISISLNYGYNFVTKAVEKMANYVPYKEVEKLLRCLNIPFNHDEETEFREFLIEKNLMKVQRSDNLMDIDLKVKTPELNKLIKERIKRADPSADFSAVKMYPDKPTVFLNGFKSKLLDSCLDDFETV